MGHRKGLSKFNKIKIIQSIVFFSLTTLYETRNQQEKIWKTYKHMGIKQHVPDNQSIKEEIKKEIIISGNK